MKIALLDFETTGLVPREGDLTEAAAQLFELHDDLTLGDLVDTYVSFNDPGRPIPPFITRKTGITDDMVKGHHIDPQEWCEFLSQADFWCAHNAAFDRSWHEHHLKSSVWHSKTWACSKAYIDWIAAGVDCAKLRCLGHEFGVLAKTSHRALADVETLAGLLRVALPGEDEEPLSFCTEMLQTAMAAHSLVIVDSLPPGTYDKLRERGFWWSKPRQAMWKTVVEWDLEALVEWVRTDIYGRYKYAAHVVPDVDPLDPKNAGRYGL